MSNIMNILTAVARVAYDKAYDYITYYTAWDYNEDNCNNIITDISGVDIDTIIENDLNNLNDEDINNINNTTSEPTSLNDSILDYQDIIDVTKYTDETQNKRILPEISFFSQYSTFLDNPTHIIDNIYLGSAYNAANYDILKEHNITVIFNVTNEIRDYFPDEFTYVRYKLYDNNKERIKSHVHDAYEKIKYHQQNTEGNIFIHCYMGKSRSATIVLFYIMKTMKHSDGSAYSFDDALEFLKSKRPIVNPTFRFTKDIAQSVIKSNKSQNIITSLSESYSNTSINDSYLDDIGNDN